MGFLFIGMKVNINHTFDTMVSNMGVLESELESFKNPIYQAVVDWCTIIIQEVTNTIEAKQIFTDRRNLKQSFLAVPVNVDGNNVEVHITAADYWALQEYGIQGWQQNNAPNSPFKFRKKQIPISSVAKWLSVKPSVVQHFKSSSPDMDIVDIATILSRSIPRKGYKARPFIAPSLNDKNLELLSFAVGEALGAKVKIVFSNNKP